jgi:hypothetical protein
MTEISDGGANGQHGTSALLRRRAAAPMKMITGRSPQGFSAPEIKL